VLVHGAFIPPRPVLEAVAAVVRSVPAPAPAVDDQPSPPKGIRGRLGRHRGDDEDSSVAAAPAVLDHVPVDLMRFPVTGFGNMTTSDAYRLTEAITAAAAEWAAPTVRFAGGTALDFPGDWSVWAKLEGDVSPLMEIARGVTQSVERLGFFVDRRVFRPMLSVATVTEATTGPYLQAIVDALDAFQGEEWTVDHVTLTKDVFVSGSPETQEFQRVPLA
jgi:2'-5' RNA ligase